MRNSALDSYVKGKKHEERVKERSKGLDILFKKSNSKDNNLDSKPTSKPKPKKMPDHLLLNTNSLNAEILRTLKFVISHLSFRSCADLSNLF